MSALQEREMLLMKILHAAAKFNFYSRQKTHDPKQVAVAMQNFGESLDKYIERRNQDWIV